MQAASGLKYGGRNEIPFPIVIKIILIFLRRCNNEETIAAQSI